MRGSDVAAEEIRHRALAAVVDWPNEIRDFVVLDVTRGTIAA